MGLTFGFIQTGAMTDQIVRVHLDVKRSTLICFRTAIKAAAAEV